MTVQIKDENGNVIMEKEVGAEAIYELDMKNGKPSLDYRDQTPKFIGAYH